LNLRKKISGDVLNIGSVRQLAHICRTVQDNAGQCRAGAGQGRTMLDITKQCIALQCRTMHDSAGPTDINKNRIDEVVEGSGMGLFLTGGHLLKILPQNSKGAS
jgi:hypothetical protein